MAQVKKDAIVFSNGRELIAPNGIISINRNLELTDYYSRCIFFSDYTSDGNRVINIYSLSKEELIEVSDLMIQLWIDLKDNVRQYGADNAKVFGSRRQRI